MTTFTGTGIQLFQLLALRSSCRLQLKTGMKPNRHTNPVMIARHRYKCKRSEVIQKLDEEILQVQDQLQPGDIRE